MLEGCRKLSNIKNYIIMLASAIILTFFFTSMNTFAITGTEKEAGDNIKLAIPTSKKSTINNKKEPSASKVTPNTGASAAKQKVASYALIEDKPCEPGRLCFIPVYVDTPSKKDKNILSLPTMLISQLLKAPDLANNNKCRGYYAIFKKDDNGDDMCNVPKCELVKKAFKADMANCCFNAFRTMTTEKESPILKTLTKEDWKKHLLQNKDMCAYYDSHTQGQPVAPAAIN